MRRDGTNDMPIPPDRQWALGKTAATIKFVEALDQYLVGHPDSPHRERLQSFRAQLVGGDYHLIDYLTVESFLQDDVAQ